MATLMNSMSDIGKILIAVGALIVIIGLVMVFAGRLGVGRLPGDFVVRRGNFTFYFPLATSIILSIVISFIFWLMRR
jgi:uncharacterized membrane-anchored protein YitT (DUF2179 family)